LKSCVEYGIDTEPASCTSTDPHVNFCIHGTKIYSLDKNNSCRSRFKIEEPETGGSTVHYLELEDKKLNAVRLDGTDKKDSFSYTIEDIENYVLVDCDNGVCRQTQGYLKNNNIFNAFVGTKGGDRTEIIADGITNTDLNLCSAGHIGKLLSTKLGICIKSEKAALLTSTDKYLISGAATGTPFEDSNGVALKISNLYIIKDKFNSEGMN